MLSVPKPHPSSRQFTPHTSRLSSVPKHDLHPKKGVPRGQMWIRTVFTTSASSFQACRMLCEGWSQRQRGTGNGWQRWSLGGKRLRSATISTWPNSVQHLQPNRGKPGMPQPPKSLAPADLEVHSSCLPRRNTLQTLLQAF